jgi:RNA polymerase sigma-70 factor (sigma-E family)
VDVPGAVVTSSDESLTRLVDERGQWLVRCAYLLTRDRERALDLSQDTLLQVWRAWDKVSAADHPDRYILRVMLNLHRSGARRRRLPEVALDEVRGIGVPDGLGAVDDLDAIAGAMRHLTDRQRAVIVLRYWADYDDVAIAEVLSCRRATVRSLAARGLAVIQANLSEEES